MWWNVLQYSLAAVAMLLIAGTVLNYARWPHWFLRGWDFPRLQIAVGLAITGGLYGWLFTDWTNWFDATVVIAATLALIVQLTWILPYTPLGPRSVQRFRDSTPQGTLRVVVSNVQMKNRDYDRWMRVITDADPDVLLALEVDDAWYEALKPLAVSHPYTIAKPQDNHYGIAVLSRFKLIRPRVRFIVESNVPSVHTLIELPDGDIIELHGVHPRPPEPRHGQDATPRDAELVVLGREIAESPYPTIIAGDLNDVAWSHTTDLFLRISRMLDPRQGRGFYNTWHAKSWIWRFPLDHIFHSDGFRLVELKVLPDVGSDHFPVLAVLSYEPAAKHVQEQESKREGDVRQAQSSIRQAESDTGHQLRSSERKPD